MFYYEEEVKDFTVFKYIVTVFAVAAGFFLVYLSVVCAVISVEWLQTKGELAMASFMEIAPFLILVAYSAFVLFALRELSDLN